MQGGIGGDCPLLLVVVVVDQLLVGGETLLP